MIPIFQCTDRKSNILIENFYYSNQKKIDITFYFFEGIWLAQFIFSFGLTCL